MKSVVKVHRTYGVGEMSAVEARAIIEVLRTAVDQDMSPTSPHRAQFTSEQIAAANALVDCLGMQLDFAQVEAMGE